MDNQNMLNELGKFLSENQISAVVTTLGAVIAGRLSHWAHIRKRFPTLTELVLEPIVIVVIGCAGAGILALFDVESNLAYAGVGSLAGRYGVTSLDFMIKAAAHKMGIKDIDICPVADDLKAHVKEDEKNDNKN